MDSPPLGKPGRPCGVRAGELICLPGGESERAGAWEWQGRLGHLGCETGTRCLLSLGCCCHSQTVLSACRAPRRTCCTGVCRLWLAEPPVVLGHFRSSCGGPLLRDFS